MTQDPTWCVMPILAGPAMTEAAVGDLLAQSVPTRLLLINQGVDDVFRDRLERLAEQEPERIFCWAHQPPLPSLSASWNRALDFVWSVGGEVALVANNDVKLLARTVEILVDAQQLTDALFVSAVGVDEAGWQDAQDRLGDGDATLQPILSGTARGGPDFSCFLISRACHWRFRFDEGHIPAFCEDLTCHREVMLAGEGQRIFSINLPYLHLASQTLKELPEKEATRIRQQIDSQSRAYYARAWGGAVNAETYLRKHDPTSAVTDGTATTPYLFDQERQHWSGPPIDELCKRMLEK